MKVSSAENIEKQKNYKNEIHNTNFSFVIYIYISIENKYSTDDILL